MVVVVGVFRKYVREPSPPVRLSAAEGSGEEEESSSPSTSFANWKSSEGYRYEATPLDFQLAKLAASLASCRGGGLLLLPVCGVESRGVAL